MTRSLDVPEVPQEMISTEKTTDADEFRRTVCFSWLILINRLLSWDYHQTPDFILMFGRCGMNRSLGGRTIHKSVAIKR